MRLRSRDRRSWLLAIIGLSALFLMASCSGPDQFGIEAITPSPMPSPTATPEPTPEPEPTATKTATATPEPTPEATATDEPDETPSPSPEATPEQETTATADAGAETPTAEPVSAMEALPLLEELTEGAGYIVANQGDRTADQLAQAYMDANAHLERLEEWGFQQHVFREFTRNESGPDDRLPEYVLATVNVYGSAEQADLAMQWLEGFQVNQGAVVVDAPDVGDASLAMTQRTSQGEDAAWVVYRYGDRVFIYYAQGNDPLEEASAVATRVFDRLSNPDDIASGGWALQA